MIEVPCTLVCDVCGAKKSATAMLNNHITEMPPSPVHKYTYATRQGRSAVANRDARIEGDL